MIELRSESVGWDNDDEMHPKAKAAQKRLNSNLGCASFLTYGFLGMGVGALVVTGVIAIFRMVGR